MNWLEEGNTSKIPNLLSQEPRYVYKTFLFYSSRNFSLRRKKERKKKQKPTAFSIPQPTSASLERWRDGGKKTGAIFATKRIWWAWILPLRRMHVQTPERILSYAGDPFHRARHGAPFGASVQRPWLLARGGANELRGSRFARNTWHLADATGCERDAGAILARKFEESLVEREGVNENVCR